MTAGPARCSEYTLVQRSGSDAGPERSTSQACWQQSNADMRIQHNKVFAPANLRATFENLAYSQLVSQWMTQRYTLRYSGGMASDVHHILAKVRSWAQMQIRSCC